MSLSVSAIVCAYNEFKTVKPILEVLANHPKIDEVIAVDDGSTDRTWQRILDVKSQKLIPLRHETNVGKGAAIADAVDRARGEILLFIDADLYRFHPVHVDLLLMPLFIDPSFMTIGLREKGSAFEDNFHALLKSFGGERAVRKSCVKPLVKRLRTSGYGVETILNLDHVHRGKDIVYIALPRLIHRTKTSKHPIYTYIAEYIKENRDVLKQLLAPENKTLETFFRRVTKKLGV